MPQKSSSLYYSTGIGPAPALKASEDPKNEPTMREGLYQATTAKTESRARSTAESAGGFGTEYVKPGRKDR
jgi:hypothetical protein